MDMVITKDYLGRNRGPSIDKINDKCDYYERHKVNQGQKYNCQEKF